MGLEFLGGGSSGGTDATAIHKADYTAKGVILSATAAGTPVAASVGADGLVPVASAADAKGWVWGSPNDPNALHKADFTTKGDLLVGTGSGTYVRLGAGSNGQRPEADSTQASGLKWSDPFTKTLADAAYQVTRYPGVVQPFEAWMMTTSAALTANTMQARRVVVPQTGTLHDFAVWVQTNVAGNFRCAIYDVGAAVSGTRTRLWQSAAAVAVGASGAWQIVDDPALLVTAGQHLDLAIISDVAPAVGKTSGTLAGGTSQLPTNFAVVGGCLPKACWQNTIGSFTCPATMSEAAATASIAGTFWIGARVT